MFLVETEFLFGLIPGDPWNRFVEEALDLIKESGVDIRCLAGGVLEVVFVAKSQNKRESEIRAGVAAMLGKMRMHGIKIVEPIDLKDILGCLSLRELYNITFYDALHASSSLNRSATIISNDETYDRIPRLKRLSIRDFIENIKP
ncbi:MAG: PIN domain-containing protein [Candidatus Bathyarchaeia archaeon]|nr:PIN domain-containing protein [Candidatus Bathyarchaeota archaeon]